MLVGRCFNCDNVRFFLKEHSWQFAPGRGRTDHFCKGCYSHRPKDFREVHGISHGTTEGAKHVRNVGTARVVDYEYGENAFGSVLAEYDDGSRLAIICGHGGSEWLCLECAKKIEVEHA